MADANTYLQFKLVDKAVTKRIVEELDSLSDAEDEGKIYLKCWIHSFYNYVVHTE